MKICILKRKLLLPIYTYLYRYIYCIKIIVLRLMQTNAVKTFLLCDIFDKRNAAMFANGLKGFLGQIMQHLAYCILNPLFKGGYVRL